MLVDGVLCVMRVTLFVCYVFLCRLRGEKVPVWDARSEENDDLNDHTLSFFFARAKKRRGQTLLLF